MCYISYNEWIGKLLIQQCVKQMSVITQNSCHIQDAHIIVTYECHFFWGTCNLTVNNNNFVFMSRILCIWAQFLITRSAIIHNLWNFAWILLIKIFDRGTFIMGMSLWVRNLQSGELIIAIRAWGVWQQPWN